MTKFPICFLLLLYYSRAFCQPAPKQEPFILKGQMKGLPAGQMILFFRDPRKGYKEYVIDTMHVDETGRFYLKTSSVTAPTMATLRKEFLSVNLYIAPGYDLEIYGDAADIALFQQKKSISGIGAAVNQYLFKADSLEWAAAAKDTIGWSGLPLGGILDYANAYARVRDSLHVAVFNKMKAPDKWAGQFSKMSVMDTRFMRMYYLIFGVMQDQAISYRQSKEFIRKHIPASSLDHLYDNSNLVSENYQGWLMGTYPAYLRTMEGRKNEYYTINPDDDIQLIDQIAKNYTNSIREIKLFTKLAQVIGNCPSFQVLNEYKERLPAYISTLVDQKDRHKLDSLLSGIESGLLYTQIAQPAPMFSAMDSASTIHDLREFSGKVIYLDFWATWCVPCLAEIPHLKALVERYKADSNVVFISISVLDNATKWKKYLQNESPAWLQLFDADGSVKKAYVASTLPKFILINKKGGIVSFDAPRPGDTATLAALINKLIAE